MNSGDVLKRLRHLYPGRHISLLPETDPREIICEVEPTSEHPNYSVAIAAISESAPHLHRDSTETYTVISGELELHVDDNILHMKNGETCTVHPNEVHWAKGDFTLVQVTSRPGWTAEDHIQQN